MYRLIWNQTDVRLFQSQSVHGKYNLIWVWFNKISEIFLCVAPEFCARTSVSRSFRPRFDCSHIFPIDLAPNGIPFCYTSMRKCVVAIYIRFELTSFRNVGAWNSHICLNFCSDLTHLFEFLFWSHTFVWMLAREKKWKREMKNGKNVSGFIILASIREMV